MANIIEFPQQNPDYSGHVLMLDLTKARKWQCFGFLVGSRAKVAPVPTHAAMDRIHAAVQAGILVDVTAHPELLVVEKSPLDIETSDTGLKAYSGTRQWFRDLGIADDDVKAPSDEVVSFGTDDPELQARIEELLAQRPASASKPVSIETARRPLIELPPGMDNPDKYILRV